MQSSKQAQKKVLIGCSVVLVVVVIAFACIVTLFTPKSCAFDPTEIESSKEDVATDIEKEANTLGYDTMEDYLADVSATREEGLSRLYALRESYPKGISDEQEAILFDMENVFQTLDTLSIGQKNLDDLAAMESAIRAKHEAVVEAEKVAERDNFIAEWTPRLDRYLSGSPLSGYGEVFASAAYDNGIDPRYSAAISCIESGKGANCFRSHNAWGWGGSSWSSWEEAIYAHARGLASGYGYTVSESAAQKYCPPNWSSWYANVSSEMSRI